MMKMEDWHLKCKHIMGFWGGAGRQIMNEMEKFCTLIKGSSSGQLEGIGINQDVEMSNC